jgi:glucosamine--fructose-6-phosphate aminotransferase (isomerizing)
MTKAWDEALEMPETLQTTLDDADGFGETAAFLVRDGVRRIVATGNGAAYVVAHALWLASLEGIASPVEVVAVPSGLVAQGRFAWRAGDALLTISASGEFRDSVEAIREGDGIRPYAAITATPSSTLGSNARARACVYVTRQDAITHTQAYAGNLLAVLAVWAIASHDESLRRAVAEVPELCARLLENAAIWAEEAADRLPSPRAAVAFGTGAAWSAALETALLLKEVAALPAEGLETREGATSGVMALNEQQLALSHATRLDPFIAEAESVCQAMGATVIGVPGGLAGDSRVAAITTFPAALAFVLRMALNAGIDADSPAWLNSYYETARLQESA